MRLVNQPRCQGLLAGAKRPWARGWLVNVCSVRPAIGLYLSREVSRCCSPSAHSRPRGTCSLLHRLRRFRIPSSRILQMWHVMKSNSQRKAPAKREYIHGGNSVSCYVARSWQNAEILLHAARTQEMFLKISRTIFCVRHKCCARGKTTQHLRNMITSAMLPPQCVFVLPAHNVHFNSRTRSSRIKGIFQIIKLSSRMLWTPY